MTSGVEFRENRERIGMTQQQAADMLGVSLRTIGNWERDGNIPQKHWGRIRNLFSQTRPEPVDPAAYIADIRAHVEHMEDVEARLEGLSTLDLFHALETRVISLTKENEALAREVAGQSRTIEAMHHAMDRYSHRGYVLAAMDRDDSEEIEPDWGEVSPIRPEGPCPPADDENRRRLLGEAARSSKGNPPANAPDDLRGEEPQ